MRRTARALVIAVTGFVVGWWLNGLLTARTAPLLALVVILVAILVIVAEWWA